MRKIPFAGIELTSQRVRELRGTSELPGRPVHKDVFNTLKKRLLGDVLDSPHLYIFVEPTSSVPFSSLVELYMFCVLPHGVWRVRIMLYLLVQVPL